jgi:hypothetical protein
MRFAMLHTYYREVVIHNMNTLSAAETHIETGA